MATNVSELMSKSNAAAAKALGLQYAGLPKVPDLSFLAPSKATLDVATKPAKPAMQAITQLGFDTALRNANQKIQSSVQEAELLKKAREQTNLKADAASGTGA